jgi:hypothetical protein
MSVLVEGFWHSRLSKLSKAGAGPWQGQGDVCAGGRLLATKAEQLVRQGLGLYRGKGTSVMVEGFWHPRLSKL